MSTLPRIIAHRGASADAPENTLAAFHLAWAQDADGIEGDFHLTADKHIVCLHDADTARVAAQQLIVANETLAALRQLDVGGWHGPRYQGEKIPTLGEVLATVPAGKHIEIEIKCGKEIIAPLLNELARAALAHEHITVICFDSEVIAALKAQAPALTAIWLVVFDPAINQRPPGIPLLQQLRQRLAQCGANGIGSDPYLPPAVAAALMADGYQWSVWTVDDAAIARQLQQAGAHSITTNTPARLRHELTALAAADNQHCP